MTLYESDGVTVLGTGVAVGGAWSITTAALASGTHALTARARDVAGNASLASGPLSITIGAVAPTISLVTASLPDGASGEAYSQTLAASGGVSPYSYVVKIGSLPDGMTLGGNGLLSGTPNVSGVFTFTVTATDSSPAPGPHAGSRAYTLNVAAAPGGIAAVPTLSEWAMILLGLMLAGSAAVTIQRRRMVA